jgi:hypothetical protein
MSISQQSMVNEARAIDFNDIRRKEKVNEVSKLSKLSSTAFGAPILCQAVVEGTAKRRAHAQRRLLRNVKIELGRIWEQEKVKVRKTRSSRGKIEEKCVLGNRLRVTQRHW